MARAEDLEAQLRHQQSESTEHTTLHEEQMFTLQAELAAGKVVAAVVADDECVAMKLESLDIEEAMS